MSGNRVTMRQRHLPTKEVFYDAGDTGNTGGIFPEGVEINANGEDAVVRVYVPFDHDFYEDMMLVVIPIATVDPMWFQLNMEWNIAGKNYNENTVGPLFYSFSAIANRITEIDIGGAVVGGARPYMEAGDYIIVNPSRQAAMPLANTNMYVCGVRFKYRYR